MESIGCKFPPRGLSLGGAFVAGLTVVGCVAPRPMIVRADRYVIEAALDPPEHRIAGRAAIDLTRLGDEPSAPGHPASIDVLLHPDLRIRRIYAGGARVLRHARTPPDEPGLEGEFKPARHTIVLDDAPPNSTLFIEYEGRLRQDIAAGEQLGEIHNFQMRAHVGPEGVYLADGYWYPQLPENQDNPSLAEYVLQVEPVSGMELVAGARRDPSLGSATGRLAWSSPYPLDGLVLVGGPHDIHHTMHRGVAIRAHLEPGQAELADAWLDALRRILDRYEPLIGPYPAGEYAVVSNFFSSGFAFPTFTLLAAPVINMGERAQTTHGYLDHEMLHSWWGNGIFVDPRDGNWCEALASYAANYYGYVLDGNEEEARRKRRNFSHFLSRTEVEEEEPLGTYGLPDGCSRGIAYSKGAAVFHMLARRIGKDNFWLAMQRFTDEYVGRYASWQDIQRLCEAQSGQPLERFFEQWVRQAGAPQVKLTSAVYDVEPRELVVAVSQEGTPFELQLPLRLHHDAGYMDRTVELTDSLQVFAVPIDFVPTSVELDPDFHVFRRVAPEEIIPTTASTRKGPALAVVLPSGEVPQRYTQVQEVFASSYEETERQTFTADQLAEGDLAERCVLILGDAARSPYVQGFLTAIDFPVRWTDGGFELSGVEYAAAGHAVLATVRHPGVEGGGVTVLYANSGESIPSPYAVPMYDRSVVVFRDGHPIERLDLERPARIPVEQAAAYNPPSEGRK